MIIGIDHSPLVSTHKIAHKIRGTGFYTKNLISSLQKYHPEHEYVLFTQGEKIKKEIDIFHYPYFDPFFLTLPFRKLGKTIITIHDLTPLVFPEQFPVGLKGRVKQQIQKALAKNADGILTDSLNSKFDIERLFGINPDKVFPVLLAADIKYKKIKVNINQKKDILSKFNIPENFVLYVGDATVNKNLKILADAFVHTDMHLVLVGSTLGNEDIDLLHPWNKDIAYVQKIAEQYRNIHILGFVSDEDLVSLYNLAEIFVFPSFYEGFGLPILEAASCGLPIITTKCGSIPEVIGDAAIFFEPNDPNELKNKIRFLMENKKERDRYSTKAIEQAKQFSWEKTADQTVEVYEKIYNQS